MKKIFALTDLAAAILFNTIIALVVAGVTGINPVALIVVWNLISLRFTKKPTWSQTMSMGILRDGLNKEVWISDLIEQFWNDNSFMAEADDMSEWVENDAINLAEAGIEPNVLINNSTFPVPFAEREDTPLRLVLNTYDTEGTVLRNAEEAELAYNKRQSIVNQHKNALSNMIGLHAANQYAPAAHTAKTPVLDKTGDDSFALEYFIEMEKLFNDMNVPLGRRVAVLTSKHLADIRTQNINLFNQIQSKPGSEIFSFKLYNFSQTPYYTVATKTKKAFGAALDPDDDKQASIFFYGGSVMKALGTTDMFERLKDPEQKGDIINFQQRALVLPKVAKYLGAIIQ
jgi:hypothetical protein